MGIDALICFHKRLSNAPHVSICIYQRVYIKTGAACGVPSLLCTDSTQTALDPNDEGSSPKMTCKKWGRWPLTTEGFRVSWTGTDFAVGAILQETKRSLFVLVILFKKDKVRQKVGEERKETPKCTLPTRLLRGLRMRR